MSVIVASSPEIQAAADDLAACLRLRGNVNIVRGAELLAAARAVSSSPPPLLVDLGGLNRLDASVLQILLALSAARRAAGAPIHVTPPAPATEAAQSLDLACAVPAIGGRTLAVEAEAGDAPSEVIEGGGGEDRP